MITFIVLLIVAVVVYHWIDKENFYGALVESKDTFRYSGHVGKNILRTSKKGWQASKAVYKAEQLEHEAAYAKAGKDYQVERKQRDRNTIKAINEVFEPVNKTLDEVSAEARERQIKALQAIDALEL